MLLSLNLHPDSECDAVTALSVEVARQGNGLVTLRYEVTGEIIRLRIPAIGPSERASELWKHTCFEAFVMQTGGAYAEFNFSPSRSWAAYHFDGYREGMRDLVTSAPQVEVQRSEGSLVLIAHTEFPETGRLGLSAVIEMRNGDVSYWALAHPAGRADFHHPVGFGPELRYL